MCSDPENPLREGMATVGEGGPCTFVIFGATGDLTRRKLFPALYNLARDGLLHPDTSVIGFARREWDTSRFREEMRAGVEAYSRSLPVDEETWNALAGKLVYVRGEFGEAPAYEALRNELARLG